jgi:hypothetical protein
VKTEKRNSVVDVVVRTQVPKLQTMGVEQRGAVIRKIHFKKPDYSKVQPKVDNRRTTARKECSDSCQPSVRIEIEKLMSDVPVGPSVSRIKDAEEAAKSQPVHIRQLHLASGTVKSQFKKQDYSEMIKTKVDTLRKRHALGGRNNEEEIPKEKQHSSFKVPQDMAAGRVHQDAIAVNEIEERIDVTDKSNFDPRKEEEIPEEMQDYSCMVPQERAAGTAYQAANSVNEIEKMIEEIKSNFILRKKTVEQELEFEHVVSTKQHDLPKKQQFEDQFREFKKQTEIPEQKQHPSCKVPQDGTAGRVHQAAIAVNEIKESIYETDKSNFTLRKKRSPSVHTEDTDRADNLGFMESPVKMRAPGKDVAFASQVAVNEIMRNSVEDVVVRSKVSKLQTMGVRQRGAVIRKIHYKKPDYSKVQPKIDNRRTTARKEYSDSCEPSVRIEIEKLMSDVPVVPSVPRIKDAEEAAKSQPVHIRQLHLASGTVKSQFKKQDYSEVKPKVDTIRRRHALGGSNNEATNQDIIQHDNVITSRPTLSCSPVSGDLVLSCAENYRTTSVPVRRKQKQAPVTVENTAGVKQDHSAHLIKTLKIARSKLETTEWETVLKGIHDVINISRCNPSLLKQHMPAIYITCSALVVHPRPQVAMASCQMAQEFFETTRCTVKPAFHKIVSALLRRTSDSNKSIRQAANEALDAMAMNIPPHNAVEALTDAGFSCKNGATARLLNVIVTTAGADIILGPTARRTFKTQVISAAAKFLQAGDTETRHHSQDLVRFLMTESEDFESAFVNELGMDKWRRIEKIVVSIRREIKRRTLLSPR